jgi:cytidylate kinase
MNNPNFFVIAIDGFTASGKGTLAAKIAKALNFKHMDTGALYRGVAKTAFDNDLDPDIEIDAIKAAQIMRDSYDISIQDDPEIRTEKISQYASKVSAIPEVRAILFDLQKNFAKSDTHDNISGVVLEGRDIGTVICPNADVKIFIEASSEVRAERRFKQLQSKNIDADYNEILQDLIERDNRDKKRDIAPTIAADDAITIDTSNLNANQVFDKAIKIIKQTTS